MPEDIRVVELFAGVGGFRVGLERASDSFRTVWANQWEPGRKNQFAFDCYNTHFGDSGSINVNKDINTVLDQIPEHDLLVGGFPCQDYSVASTNAKGIEGKKGVLWWPTIEIIRSRKPKYIFLENVDRLIKSPASQRGRDFGIMLRTLADEGYRVEWRVINAAEYGMQQKRRRIFIFACRKDVPFADVYNNDSESVMNSLGFFAVPFPITGDIKKGRVHECSISTRDYDSLVDVSDGFQFPFERGGIMVDHIVYTREVTPQYDGDFIALGDILVDDASERYVISGDDLEAWRYMKGSKKIPRVDRNGFAYMYSEGAIPFPDNLDVAGRTMLTSEGAKNRSSHIVQDPHTRKYRTLTPVECERLNGFPDDWTDTGMTDRQRYFTMGNALVVQIIERMGRRLLDIIDYGAQCHVSKPPSPTQSTLYSRDGS